MVDLGTLSQVKAKDVWPNEDKDFTPWLADNADLLSEALGVELEHEQTEAPVGRYRADLVFRWVSKDELVVVENMFRQTDHDHMGKLITYAAGLGARYAVLISPDFRDEHRSALTWLNSVSTEDFGFFGVVLETWRIDDSAPAPRLRVDIKPDGWSQQMQATTFSPSETYLAYEQFWTKFLPEFHNRYPGWTRANSPGKKEKMSFRSLRSKQLKYHAAFCQPDGTRYGLRAAAYIDTRDAETNKAVFDDLLRHKERIEKTVGEELHWEKAVNDGKGRASRISVYFPDDIRVAEDKHRWPEALDWLINAMGRMRDAFDSELQDALDPEIRDAPDPGLRDTLDPEIEDLEA